MPEGSFHDASALLPGARKGRGAITNPAIRFDRHNTVAFDDGWDTLEDEAAELPPLATTLIRDSSRTALAWNKSPDIGFDRSINPYRGCEHGCVYCFARPTHAYLGFSPGLDFETKLLFKPQIAELLEAALRKPGYTAAPVALGSNTDPYQPVERTLKLTRAVLEVLEQFNHPVAVVTKSAGVLRDIDILSRMAARGLARVCLSVTTLDAKLARSLEPRASTPERRLDAIARLTEAGIPVAVLAAPMIPAVNDMELERILERAASQGADRAGYVLLRLPLELGEIFEAWLHQHMPDRAAKVMALVRQTRGGETYDSRFGQRQTGSGPYAEMLGRRFQVATRRLGLDRRQQGHTGPEGLRCDLFAVPPKPGEAVQLALF
ncbi:PA0069 family radical SAM protein [Pseudoroseomonas ludipueritiae]|uniref:PA0069 family radical SAM protein n=1 Tax=Pseudoroseomonas ludipueritiae TaxID=198093 RepID=A0ABR7R3V6_9PROT|nr:PA0069 family radical SAM protein [Pseudoroseomonas ludipueritiae]MBC9176450.1 PA0069 family radical SAM protein [Pseudoroseomonas ludipueritiae]MCG7363566.1 PA0069 family radical SAM protein [Roseomonas sp. ACRSG]